MSNYLFKRTYLTARKNVSGLIRMSLTDLESVEKDPAYFIDLGMYHRPIVYVCKPVGSCDLPEYRETRCGVCLAGSMIARRFDASPTDDLQPDEELFAPLVNRQLLALDEFRVGETREGWQYLFHTQEDPWDIDRYSFCQDSLLYHPISEPYPLPRTEYKVPAYADDPAGFKKALHDMADRFEKAGY